MNTTPTGHTQTFLEFTQQLGTCVPFTELTEKQQNQHQNWMACYDLLRTRVQRLGLLLESNQTWDTDYLAALLPDTEPNNTDTNMFWDWLNNIILLADWLYDHTPAPTPENKTHLRDRYHTDLKQLQHAENVFRVTIAEPNNHCCVNDLWNTESEIRLSPPETLPDNVITHPRFRGDRTPPTP